jgi:hypothetical protein
MRICPGNDGRGGDNLRVHRPLELKILPQPTDVTCGPTCLQAVYGYYGDDVPLEQVIAEVRTLEHGGTLAVLLGRHALERGYDATIYTWNLTVFDPTWFRFGVDIQERLRAQRGVKSNALLHAATEGYLDFLEHGGRIRHAALTGGLLRRFLRRGIPILTGLSATYLYQTARERDVEGRAVYDDLRGEPAGHFVVISGYNPVLRCARVSDPYPANPVAGGHYYDVDLPLLVGSIFLGIVTFDANILLLRPSKKHVDTDRR